VIASESSGYIGQLDWPADVRVGEPYDSFTPDRRGPVAIRIDRYTT
jgi:hypothetical protein